MELTDISEQLIYHETWRLNNCQIVTNHDDLKSWMLSENPSEFNSHEHDYLIATYLTCLMYTAKQDNKEAQTRLINALRNVFEADENEMLEVRISKGPAIQIGPMMVRTRCVIAQALTFLPHILPKHKYTDQTVERIYSRSASILEDVEKAYENGTTN